MIIIINIGHDTSVRTKRHRAMGFRNEIVKELEVAEMEECEKTRGIGIDG